MYGPLELKNREQVGTVADELKHAQLLGHTITINSVSHSNSLLINHYHNEMIVRQVTVGPRGGSKVDKG